MATKTSLTIPYLTVFDNKNCWFIKIFFLVFTFLSLKLFHNKIVACPIFFFAHPVDQQPTISLVMQITWKGTDLKRKNMLWVAIHSRSDTQVATKLSCDTDD